VERETLEGSNRNKMLNNDFGNANAPINAESDFSDLVQSLKLLNDWALELHQNCLWLEKDFFNA